LVEEIFVNLTPEYTEQTNWSCINATDFYYIND